GLLQRGQVLALQVLDEREFQTFLGTCFTHEHRHGLQVRPFRGLQAPFAGDQLEATRDTPNDQWLEEAVTTDRFRQRRERLLVEGPAWLVGIRHDLAHRYRALRPDGRRGLLREEGLQPPAERLPHHPLRLSFYPLTPLPQPRAESRLWPARRARGPGPGRRS